MNIIKHVRCFTYSILEEKISLEEFINNEIDRQIGYCNNVCYIQIIQLKTGNYKVILSISK